MSYGLPAGTNIPYGGPGFPAWVTQLANQFNLQASTYAGHQETDRVEAGYARNPQQLNRGIDWAGSVPDMQRFADYLLTVKESLEQVIWENPVTKKRVGVAGGRDVSTTNYFTTDYAGHRDHVHTRQSAPIPIPAKDKNVPERPDFNEYPVWSTNCQSRNNTKVDLFLLHTQEGTGNADQLARWLGGNVNASYHYTISMDPRDKGITVCDVVDTDLASWSVLSANNRSINLCFAGSRASWSRQQWIDNVGRAIDVAAYLAVQDCKKYKIPFTVIRPPYTAGRTGISDHNFVTKVLKDGTHTDVGPNFPWDVFETSVAKYAGVAPQPAPPKPDISTWSDRQLLEEIWKLVST